MEGNMSRSIRESEAAMKNHSRLLDPSGNDLPQQITWSERWKAISSKAKVIVVSAVVLIAGTASLLGNLESIQNHFRSKPASPPIPLIKVKLANRQAKDAQVAARGDFFLWLPGLGTRHTVGKYEFRTIDGNFPE